MPPGLAGKTVRCAGCGQTLRVPTTAGAQRPSRPEQPRAERPSEPLDEAAVLTEVARAVSSHAVDGREPRRWGGLVTVLIVLLVAGGGAVAWQMGYIKLDAINPPPSPQEIARQANDERSRRLFKVELVGSDTQTTPVNLQLKLTNTAGKDIRSFIGSVFLYSPMTGSWPTSASRSSTRLKTASRSWTTATGRWSPRPSRPCATTPTAPCTSSSRSTT